jgi:hypothetical protein
MFKFFKSVLYFQIVANTELYHEYDSSSSVSVGSYIGLLLLFILVSLHVFILWKKIVNIVITGGKELYLFGTNGGGSNILLRKILFYKSHIKISVCDLYLIHSFWNNVVIRLSGGIFFLG